MSIKSFTYENDSHNQENIVINVYDKNEVDFHLSEPRYDNSASLTRLTLDELTSIRETINEAIEYMEELNEVVQITCCECSAKLECHFKHVARHGWRADETEGGFVCSICNGVTCVVKGP